MAKRHISIKSPAAIFWATLDKTGLLFIPASGHTASKLFLSLSSIHPNTYSLFPLFSQSVCLSHPLFVLTINTHCFSVSATYSLSVFYAHATLSHLTHTHPHQPTLTHSTSLSFLTKTQSVLSTYFPNCHFQLCLLGFVSISICTHCRSLSLSLSLSLFHMDLFS